MSAIDLQAVLMLRYSKRANLSLVWAKNYLDKPICYRNGHYNLFYHILQDLIFNIIIWLMEKPYTYGAIFIHFFYCFLDKNCDISGLVKS